MQSARSATQPADLHLVLAHFGGTRGSVLERAAQVVGETEEKQAGIVEGKKKAEHLAPDVFAVFEAQLKEFAAALLLLGSKDYCPASFAGMALVVI